MPTVTKLEQTFLDLVAIDEVHPHEDQVLVYIKRRLDAAGVPFRQDAAGNIVAQIAGAAGGPAIALVGHTDIAAPLAGRQVVVAEGVIKTDGHGLLGADDKAAVAAMLELADGATSARPARTIELVFTVGEEAGCVGAVGLDMALVSAKQAVVLDWTGRVNRVITRSPAYFKIDVEYRGRAAHPAEWQEGKNAGAALIAAAAQLRQGEYASGVTCNIGVMQFGDARNKVPGHATLQAELRSYDTAKITAAAAEGERLFRATAAQHGVEAQLAFVKDSPAYELNQDGELITIVEQALATAGLQPHLEPTYGCFDGNILAARGLDTIMLGAAYYHPHSAEEYLNRAEFAELLTVLKILLYPPKGSNRV
ncbi:MAG TPA: M20/M25/M40 family metallo-hydrolase [Candidatus Saccharimonadia bacterium]|nr:M20/M25/M40 family metallo-hydrolase [Candidatus Saccharimonadia bacterium]